MCAAPQASARTAPRTTVRGEQAGLPHEPAAGLRGLQAAEGVGVTEGAAYRGRRLIEGSKTCGYDDECDPGKKCVFDRDAFNLGLCSSRCGLCSL